MGEKVQVTPPLRASAAETAAQARAAPGLKEAAMARGVGKMVRWPWMTSRPMSRGMPWAEDSTAARWTALVRSASPGQKRAPMPPRAAARHASWLVAKVIWIWLSFSSQVREARISSMRSRWRAVSWLAGAVAGVMTGLLSIGGLGG